LGGLFICLRGSRITAVRPILFDSNFSAISRVSVVLSSEKQILIIQITQIKPVDLKTLTFTSPSQVSYKVAALRTAAYGRK
jgi:hypothetical protein